MTLILGLSSETIGLNDREQVYIRVFNLLKSTNSFSECIELMSARITSGWGFYVITWLISRFISDSNIYLFIMAIPLNFVVIRLIKRYSTNYGLSVLIYITLIYPLLFTILRQSVAMALILIAYEMYKDKRYIFSLVIYILAVSMHLSALAFIVVVVLSKLKFRLVYFIIPIASFAIANLSRGTIIKLLSSVMFDETYSSRYLSSSSSVSSMTAIAIRLLIAVFIYIMCKYSGGLESASYSEQIPNIERKTVKYLEGKIVFLQEKTPTLSFSLNFLMWCSLAAATSVTLMGVIGEFQRIAAYFDVFAVFSIPIAVDKFESYNRDIVVAVITAFLTIYFLGFQLENWNLTPYMLWF